MTVPARADTRIASRITGNEAALKASVALHPLGRIAQPDEVRISSEMGVTVGRRWGEEGGGRGEGGGNEREGWDGERKEESERKGGKEMRRLVEVA